jgi:LysR family transcriptional activator of nhaA
MVMSDVRRLNYQHLLYFWTVVREGSITQASEVLHLSAPAISAQLKTLEARLGEKLLEKSGRTLAPTEAGQVVYRYAEEIFGLGRDLLATLAQRPTGRPLRFVVGIDDVLPKEIAYRLLDPALRIVQPVRLVCHEGTLERLTVDLAAHDVDVVLSDAPMSPRLDIRAYNHPLGRCDVLWMGPKALAKKMLRSFPQSLNGARILLPTDDTAIRRSLDQWLDRRDVRPVPIAEFEDYALLREFARAGHGIAPVPAVLAGQFHDRYGFEIIGRAEGVEAQFFAISLERKIRHPALVAVMEHAAATFQTSEGETSRGLR